MSAVTRYKAQQECHPQNNRDNSTIACSSSLSTRIKTTFVGMLLCLSPASAQFRAEPATNVTYSFPNQIIERQPIDKYAPSYFHAPTWEQMMHERQEDIIKKNPNLKCSVKGNHGECHGYEDERTYCEHNFRPESLFMDDKGIATGFHYFHCEETEPRCCGLLSIPVSTFGGFDYATIEKKQ
jgi:hypothetical protein